MFTFKQQQLHESSLSRIYQHSQESNLGMITAYRGQYSVQQNEKRNSQLMSDIRSAGFGYVPVTGHYIENPGTPEEQKVIEKSFLVISSSQDSGKLKHFLQNVGVKYDQDSVLYKDSKSDEAILIGTASGRWPGLKVEVKVGKWKPNAIGSYYTKMKGHRTFAFESVEAPESLMSRGFREKLTKK
jgi:hypothetical protein